MDTTSTFPADRIDPPEDAHTTSRTSARRAPVELVTRSERRRVWTEEQKREIVAESLGPALTPTEVARAAAPPGHVPRWRHGQLDAVHSCRETLSLVRSRGGDWLVPVKGNTPTLRDEVMVSLDAAAKPITVCEKGHGRLDTRAVRVVTDTDAS